MYIDGERESDIHIYRCNTDIYLHVIRYTYVYFLYIIHVCVFPGPTFLRDKDQLGLERAMCHAIKDGAVGWVTATNSATPGGVPCHVSCGSGCLDQVFYP